MLSVMENLKLVSVRLDPRDLEIIDKECRRSMWRKRSSYISQAVALMAALIKTDQDGKVLSFYPQSGDVIDEFVLKYHREVRK